MKIAIAYDWFDTWGGVERVLLELHAMFPQAVFFTSYVHREKGSWAKDLKVKTSFIQNLPGAIRMNRKLSFPLYPFAFESFDTSAFDLVISVTSSFGKAVVTRPGTRHICYLLTPTRYLWVYPSLYFSKASLTILGPYLSYIKRWDKIASARPDTMVAISKAVADRCLQVYHREAEVIHPPFEPDYWRSEAEKAEKPHIPFTNYYLAVSRLEPYKRIDLLLDVFKARPDLALIVVGKGSMRRTLEAKSPSNVVFLCDLSDAELAHLYRHAEALLMPQEEDFGYTALEAQSLGCPVVAYAKGGSRETVSPRSGFFFEEQSKQAVMNALERLHTISYNGKKLAQNEGPKWALSFSRTKFRNKFFSLI